ncbi:MAG: hypothetical protein KDB80_15005 [Planctomycetes bacterium]|nr:hypothetical protein [Planctomycetota bacterium]
MGHIVFAAPTIGRFHLHDVLARQLMRRGHRVTVLAADPVTECFYRAQGMRTHLLPLRRATAELRGMPLGSNALRDCRLAGSPRPSSAQLGRARARLGRFVPELLRFFGIETPEIVLFHQERTGLHGLIDFVAQEFGCEVLHTGAGLLPGTMQWDARGIDGDSSICDREPDDYRHAPRDQSFVMAALAAVLGGVNADPIGRSGIRRPGLFARTRSFVRALKRRQTGPARGAFSAWRLARPTRTTRPKHTSDLPEGPFVTVLLQDLESAALRLDADDPPSHAQLILAAHAATWAFDSTLPLVVIPPAGGLSRRVRRTLSGRVGRIVIGRPEDAMNAVTTGLAVATVNHPHGLAAMLAGTPLLHTGRALYTHAGIAHATTLDRMRDDLPKALEQSSAPYRESYLTRTLVYDHIWCDADQPDENGLHGLVQNVERSADRARPTTERISYRAGPAWLATEE